MRIHVGLMGGLGNQLFQLAAALNIALLNNQKTFLNPNLSNCRTNSAGLPEISSYALPDSVELKKLNKSRFWVGKVLGHARKIKSNPSGFEKSYIYQRFISVIAKVHTFFLVGPRANVNFIDEIGYVELDPTNLNSLYLGYFQSFRYLESPQVLDQLRKLHCDEFIFEQKAYAELAGQKKLLVVHVRLGDYLNEDKFGVPSKRYYEESIRIQMDSGRYDLILLFSDNPESALDFIPDEYLQLTQLVVDCLESSAATLELMRYGKGYVIGNSTFSWWGAMLSHTDSPKVIAPTPWFKGMSEPADLIPRDWKRVQAWAPK